MQGDRIAPWVAAEQPHGAAVGAQQAEQHANGGGLARSVGAEKAGDVTRRDGQVQTVECLGVTERLCQVADFDSELGAVACVSPLQ